MSHSLSLSLSLSPRRNSACGGSQVRQGYVPICYFPCPIRPSLEPHPLFSSEAFGGKSAKKATDMSASAKATKMASAKSAKTMSASAKATKAFTDAGKSSKGSKKGGGYPADGKSAKSGKTADLQTPQEVSNDGGYPSAQRQVSE